MTVPGSAHPPPHPVELTPTPTPIYVGSDIDTKKRKMGVGDNLKEAVIDDIKQIKAYQWIFLVLNIIFNGLVTIFAMLFLVPYAIELIIRNESPSTRQLLMSLLSNQPYLVLFTLPALLISLFVPLYRRPWFLVLYRIVQSFVGWVIIAVGVATIMEAIRCLLTSWTNAMGLWPTAFVSIVAGAMFVLQGSGMFTTVFLSNILFHYFITKSVSEDNVEKARNFFAKSIAAALNIIEVIITIVLLVYSGFHVYLLFSDQQRTDDPTGSKIGETVVFSVFCVCAVISLISSIAGAIIYVVTIFVQKTKPLYPAIFFGVNLAECILFALIFFIITVALVLISWSNKRDTPPTPPTPIRQTDFFDAMWSIGVLCLWKILLSVSGVEVVFGNFRLATTSGGDIFKSKKSKSKEKEVDLSV